MTNINVVLGRAEASLAKANELFENVKRAYGPVIRQERQAREREVPYPHENVDLTNDSSWTPRQVALRKAAGLEKNVPPVVGALDENQARRRTLAGLAVRPAATVITRPCAFVPMVAQEAHARIEKLDQALPIASQAIDRKASVDVPGYPTLMTAAELWAALEEETSALRQAAKP